MIKQRYRDAIADKLQEWLVNSLATLAEILPKFSNSDTANDWHSVSLHTIRILKLNFVHA